MTKEYIERGYPTCKDCFHWVACKKMLDAAGITVSEDYAPDANRCDDFVPAADVVEVKHGRWLARARKNGVGKCCSACMTAFNFAPTPYCPNCGAKMDGE